MTLNFWTVGDVLCVVRTRRRGFGEIAVAGVACVVLGVPAFAQSDNRAWPPGPASAAVLRADRTTAGVVRIYASGAASVGGVSLPDNLMVPPDLRPLLESMLRASPTFRRQCLRILDAPRLTVAFEYFQPSTDRMRARTTVSMGRDGRRMARVAMRSLDDPVELIAHEIEHVIEQLDGIDLAARAAVPTSGVHLCDCGNGAFETERAIRVGLAVAREFRQHAP